MELFGIIGFVFGMLGLAFGLMSLSTKNRLNRIEDHLKGLSVLEKDFNSAG